MSLDLFGVVCRREMVVNGHPKREVPVSTVSVTERHHRDQLRVSGYLAMRVEGVTRLLWAVSGGVYLGQQDCDYHGMASG